ncbi:hypothetical protein ACYOEI_01510 [Singulisphaera rosea]
MMRRLENYVREYGPEFGPILYRAIRSQAAQAGVSTRLRRTIDVLTGKTPTPVKREKPSPLFETKNADPTIESTPSVANAA